MPDDSEDLIDCPAQGYAIARKVCRARRSRGEKRCRRCAENTDQMFLFRSPRQIVSPRGGDGRDASH